MALKNQEPAAVKFWTPLRLVSTLIVLGMLAAFGASSCNSNDPATPAPKRVTIARSSNDASGGVETVSTLPNVVRDMEMKSAKGQPIKLSDYSGKVLLVNLWATWCGPCRNETPELVKLYNEYQDRGVEMLGLSTEDPVSSAQSVQQFMRQYKVGYHVGWAPYEVKVALMQGRTSIPQSFIMTRDGRIIKRFVGFNPRQTPSQLKQAIEEALVDNG
jgi:glutathione peroxidase-family protein